jgi:phage tail sheath protein FI
VPEYLTPGVYFEFRDAAPPIRGVRTDITGFVGLAERGPLNRPVQIESWRQFQAKFGSFQPYGFLAFAVKGFFENSGRTCFVTRIAGSTAAPATYILNNKAGAKVIRINAINEGTWGNRIRFLLKTRPLVGEFSLVVATDGPERESFPRLSVNPDDSRYFETFINEGDEVTPPSSLISIGVVEGLPSGTDLLPDVQQSALKLGTGNLSGGQDGLASLTRQDFLGDADALATPRKGLSAFDRVEAVSIICVPDILVQPFLTPPAPPPEPAPPHDPCLPMKGAPSAPLPPNPGMLEQPPVFSIDDVLAVQRAMIEHCERHKNRVAILDAPVHTGGAPYTVAEIQDWRSQFDSSRGFGALYYPWVKVVDPFNPGKRLLHAVPPSGHIAGLYARTDFSAGVHKAPANAELLWSEDITASVNDEVQGILNPLGINCVRAFPGRGIRVYGARTVSSDADWRYVNVRRLMLMIEKAVEEATQWAVFEPNDFNLRSTLIVGVSTFLESVWRQGALTGATAKEAFYVKCDATNNPPEEVDAGKLIMEVGVAPTHPAEFIIFRIGRTIAELEIVER